jgi:formylglycine-generating enzyme
VVVSWLYPSASSLRREARRRADSGALAGKNSKKWLNTTPVGSLEPNAYGVYDMIGNVSEWIEGCHASSHEAVSAPGAPPVAEGPCAKRIAKGGSWGTLGNNLRTGERSPYAATHRDDSIGIRLANTPR